MELAIIYFKFLILSAKSNPYFLFLILLQTILNFIYTYLALRVVFWITNSVIYQDFNYFKNTIAILSTCILVKLIDIIISGELTKNNRIFVLSLEQEMIKKNMSISYDILESTKFRELARRVDFSINNQSILESIIESSSGFFKSISAIFASIFVISAFSLYIIFIFLFSIVLVTFVRYKFNKCEIDFFKNLGSINNRYWYFKNFIFQYDKILDIKANKLENLIQDKFSKETKNMNKYFNEYFTKNSKSMAIISAIGSLQFTIIFIFLIFSILNNSISISDFTFFLSASTLFSQSISKISEDFLDLHRMCSFLQPVMELFGIKEMHIKEKINKEYTNSSIVFENVNFSYDKNLNVLKNISFEIPTGNIVSIIGENGAGKSTLVKLIAGLFVPTSGYISTFEENSIKSVFQDFKIIENATVLENIVLKTTNVNKDEEIKILNKIITKMGLSLTDDLYFSFDDIIGSGLHEKGIDLSGGQKQLIAILRCLYHKSKIIILDEPTSNIDIKKEEYIFSSLNNFKKDKVIFIISHSNKIFDFVDYNIFLKNGQIEKIVR
ncbi:MAG: ABC transporter ATP-binding protein/permease [Defluviitaleaceae bacterium]|nr:ABC transporter ATP-binding protein/permease [Defluviitaleaceae bacterium]